MPPFQSAFRQTPLAFRSARPAYQQPTQIPQLGQEEGDRELLRRLASFGMSAIGKGGAGFDVSGGAASIRNALVGKSLLAPLGSPLSFENRATGRDVLEHYGVLGKNRPGLDVGDVAGFATEVLLDPWTYATFGLAALSKAGKAARAANMLGGLKKIAPLWGQRLARTTKTPMDLLKALPKADRAGVAREFFAAARKQGQAPKALLNQKLGGPIGFSALPFGFGPKYIPTGPKAQAAAAGLDKLWGTVAGVPGIRHTRGLLLSKYKGQTGTEAQKVAELAYEAEKGARHPAFSQYAEIHEKVNQTHADFDKTIGDFVRGPGRPGAEASIEGIPYAAEDVVFAADRANYGYVQRMTKDGAEVYFESPQGGAESVWLPHDQLKLSAKKSSTRADEMAQRLTRSVFERVMHLAAEKGSVGDAARTVLPGLEKRIPEGMSRAILRHGEDIIEANKAIAKAVNEKGGSFTFLDESDDLASYFGHMARYVNKRTARKHARVPKMLSTSHASQFARADAVRYVPKEVVNQITANPSLRGKNAWETIKRNWGGYLGEGYGGDVDEHAKAIAAWLKGRPVQQIFTASTMGDFLKYQLSAQRLSRTWDGIHTYFNHNAIAGGGLGDEIPLEEAFRSLAAGSGDEANKAAARAIKHYAEVNRITPDAARTYVVRPETVAAAQKILKPHVSPEWAKEIGHWIDESQRWFKQHVTIFPIFPSFFARNKLSGEYVNLTSGLIETPADWVRYFKKYARAHELSKAEMAAIANGPQRMRVAEQARAAFGGEADEGLVVMDAHARVWANKTGRDADEWFERIGEIRKGEPGDVGAGGLMHPAYHGSPYRFDKFTTDKIGAGEGGQAYGWGLYFAEEKKVAEYYKSRMFRDAFRSNRDTPSLYEVDLAPKQDDYLLWDKPLSEQSAKVQEALQGEFDISNISDEVADRILIEQYGWEPHDIEWAQKHGDSRQRMLADAVRFTDEKPQITGAQIYETLAGRMGGREAHKTGAASKYLNSKGIRGIKYLDKGSRAAGKGTHNYVIFDDADIAIKQVLEQRNRGAVEFARDGRAVITAFKNADISTFVHETAHIFRRSLADVDDDLLQRAESALGVKDRNWTRVNEEAFSSGFERYLRDGKAPTSELKSVFKQFKDWLRSVYQSIAGTPLEKNVSPQLKSVFDEMLGSKLPKELDLGRVKREIQSGEFVGGRTGLEDVEIPGGGREGVFPGGLKEPFNVKRSYAESLEDLAVPGEKVKIGALRKTRAAHQAAIRTGAKINRQVEWYNRVPMYLYLTEEKGWTPAAAAAKVNELQFDYSDLAPFEKSVMRRAFPFYSFTRKAMPLTIETLMERPGGGLAQNIRGTNLLRSKEEALPDYVSKTSAIPLAPGPEGHKRYLTLGGFVHEDALSFFSSPRDAGYEALSRSNPYAKALLEGVTGQSFFQRGRKLADMDPLVGRTISNVLDMEDAVKTPHALEVAATASPLTRVMSSLKTATHPKKPARDRLLNLLTGFRVTSLSPGAQDKVIRDLLDPEMRKLGGRSFEKMWIPEDVMAKMSPEELVAAQRAKALSRILGERGKARAEARKAAEK